MVALSYDGDVHVVTANNVATSSRGGDLPAGVVEWLASLDLPGGLAAYLSPHTGAAALAGQKQEVMTGRSDDSSARIRW